MTTPDSKLVEECTSNENGDKVIPEGWVKTTLQELLDVLESGSRPKGGVRGISEGIPSIGGEHLNSGGSFKFDSIKYVPQSFFDRMNQGHIQFNDILIVKDGATTAKVSLVREDFPFKPAVVNEHVFICRPAEDLFSLFLFYFLFSDEGQNRILENFRGSAQGGINHSFAAGTTVLLAPTAEQKRIVAKIEKLLPQVNSAKERLNRASQIMKRFRQAVLNAACSGRLTEGWRKEHPNVESAEQLLVRINLSRKERIGKKCDAHFAGTVNDSFSRPDYIENEGYDGIPSSWIWCRVSQIATVYIGGTPSRKQLSYWDGDIPWVSSGEVANCHIKTTREYITLEGLNNSSAKLYPLNTILIAMIGEGKTRGQAAILNIECCTNQNVAGIVVEAGVLPDYVWRWALSEYETNRSVGRGGSQPALNKQKVNELWLPLPPYEEQQEIVGRVEILFKLADAIEKRIEAARLRSDKITQSILAKAFRGELVLNEAELASQEGRSYEPASVLLERIKAEREKKPGSPRRGGSQ